MSLEHSGGKRAKQKVILTDLFPSLINIKLDEDLVKNARE